MTNLTRMLTNSLVACTLLGSTCAFADPGAADLPANDIGATFAPPDDGESEIDISAAIMASIADADPEAGAAIPEPSEWRFIFEAVAWLPLRIKGPMTVGPTTTAVDIDLKTIFEDLKMVMEGGLEVTNGKWSFLVWGVYFNLGDDASFSSTMPPPAGVIDISLGFEATIVDMAVAYRIGDWPIGDSNGTWGLDLLTGMVIFDTQSKVGAAGPLGFDPMIKLDESWVDYIVGGRIVFNFSDKLSGSVRGDVGGFGIGSSSELLWIVQIAGEYKIHPNIGVVLGYRYLDVDWSKGSGLGAAGYDWVIHGPIIGANIHF